VHCGLKKDGALDLGLLLADRPVTAAAVYTQNRLVGAHVTLCREHLTRSGGLVRAVLVNSRNANCATGEQGVRDARRCCAGLARRIGCAVEQVLMVSTGPIGAPLPVAKIEAGLGPLLDGIGRDGGMPFARAIMTTDTYPKARSLLAGGARVTGFAKGAGMIHPDLATMLAFLLSDGSLGAAGPAVARIANRSLNRVTVDGDGSPNDTLLALCGGGDDVEAGMTRIACELALRIAGDGEGASRLVTVEVRGARSESEAVQVGRVVATSPLVKTAIAGRDPNWGRILSAAGRAGVPFAPAQARVWIGATELYRDGVPHPANEAAASRYLREQEQIVIGVDLGLGEAGADVWTCDLTADYVRINADYRT
jgi:glutamate N-acetyltransferase/amino-acid N-acetyltransferase